MSDNQRYEAAPGNQNQQADYTQNKGSYDLKREGEVYQYQPSGPEPEKTKTSSTWLVITALVLVAIFVFSIVGMRLVFKRTTRQAKQARTVVSDQKVWQDETDRDSDRANKVPAADLEDSDSELEESEKTEMPDLRKPGFSLEEATRQYRDGQASLTIAEIAAAGKESVVAISTETSVVDYFGGVRQASFAGSGFIISQDGYIATNSHVVNGAEKIFVKLDSGIVYQADLVAEDRTTDLAVIKLSDYDGDKDLVPAKLGNSSQLVVGELAVAIGNPTGQLEGTVTNGIISALNREINFGGLDMTMIQTNASVNSGNSGGALFNCFGEVVGVITGKISASSSGPSFEGLGFAIPIDTAKPVLEDLIKFGYVRGRVSLGIYPESLSRERANHYGLADRAGVLILKVEEGSSADQAGLKRGDLIISLNGQNVENIDDINRYKRDLKPGDEIDLEYYREGDLRQGKLVLTEFKPGK